MDRLENNDTKSQNNSSNLLMIKQMEWLPEYAHEI